MQANSSQKKVGVAILISDKVNFKSWNVIRDNDKQSIPYDIKIYESKKKISKYVRQKQIEFTKK